MASNRLNYALVCGIFNVDESKCVFVCRNRPTHQTRLFSSNSGGKLVGRFILRGKHER